MVGGWRGRGCGRGGQGAALGPQAEEPAEGATAGRGCRPGAPEQPLVQGRIGRPAGPALSGVSLRGEWGGGDPERRERRRVALAETEERAPEAWAGARTAPQVSGIAPAGSRFTGGKAFRARDEYRPAAIVICAPLNGFLPLKGGGGLGGVT